MGEEEFLRVDDVMTMPSMSPAVSALTLRPFLLSANF